MCACTAICIGKTRRSPSFELVMISTRAISSHYAGITIISGEARNESYSSPANYHSASVPFRVASNNVLMTGCPTFANVRTTVACTYSTIRDT